MSISSSRATPDRVAIVTIFRNNADFLEQCFASVGSQTCPKWHHYVFDDGSNDGGTEYAVRHSEQHHGKVLLAISADSAGKFHRVKTFEQVIDGGVIIFLDGDDYLHPQAVERVLDMVNMAPEFDLFFTGCFGVLGKKVVDLRANQTLATVENLANRMLPPHMFAFRASAYFDEGGIDSSYHVSADFELKLRMAKTRPIFRYPEPMYFHRCHWGQMTKRQRPEQLQQQRRALEAHGFKDKVVVGHGKQAPALIRAGESG